MRKMESNLIAINVIFVTFLIIANIVTSKVIDTGLSIMGTDILIPGAALTYAFTFLCTDIIGEVWGKEEANKAVKIGFISQIIALTLIVLTSFLPASDIKMQESYNMLLGQTPFFVLGSLAAYYCSQKCDVWIFHFIRDRYNAESKFRWIWNNASTCTSQIIDTAIFITIAFGIGNEWLYSAESRKLLGGMILGQYILKVVIAILDTPFFYLLTNKKQNKI